MTPIINNFEIIKYLNNFLVIQWILFIHLTYLEIHLWTPIAKTTTHIDMIIKLVNIVYKFTHFCPEGFIVSLNFFLFDRHLIIFGLRKCLIFVFDNDVWISAELIVPSRTVLISILNIFLFTIEIVLRIFCLHNTHYTTL